MYETNVLVSADNSTSLSTGRYEPLLRIKGDLEMEVGAGAPSV